MEKEEEKLPQAPAPPLRGSILRLTNYSANGYNLRLKLEKGRSWKVRQNAVIEIDPPSDHLDHGDDYAHFVYELFLSEEDFGVGDVLPLESLVHLEGNCLRGAFMVGALAQGGKALLERVKIYIVEFATKEVVEIVRPYKQFDAISFTLKEENNGWALVMECVYEDEQVWVWAREVIGNQKR